MERKLPYIESAARFETEDGWVRLHHSSWSRNDKVEFQLGSVVVSCREDGGVREWSVWVNNVKEYTKIRTTRDITHMGLRAAVERVFERVEGHQNDESRREKARVADVEHERRKRLDDLLK